MQVADRRQDLEDVGDRLLDRQRIGRAVIGVAATLEHVVQARAVDELHHDVAGAAVFDEVVDLHDVRMLDLGQESLFGERGDHRVAVAAVEHPLEHDPSIGDLAVGGEIDPTEPAMGEAAGDLVLTGDHFTGRRASARN